MPTSGIRALRRGTNDYESNTEVPEAASLLRNCSADHSLDLGQADLEDGLKQVEHSSQSSTQQSHDSDDESIVFFNKSQSYKHHTKRNWKWRIPTALKVSCARCLRLLGDRSRHSKLRGHGPSALKTTLRLIALLLMLLGFLHFIALICGLYLSFFPDEVPWPEELVANPNIPYELGHWPTDTTADIKPVACHSHNDYWRKEPLFSALRVGCTGVEADVWLIDEELYVGHIEAALTPNRTLRSLYINPLLDLLDKQNPITQYHPKLDVPRNGVFDTNPKQTLVLLVDFKNDGETIWPYVKEQLQPLRDKHYLTYFNGTDVIEGAITVVVTGNAPFRRVVENPHYRDMFFDAPLDVMAKMPGLDQPDTYNHEETEYNYLGIDNETTSTGGQGHSGGAPLNPFIYSRANSYYASVSFKRSILHFPFPIRNQLSKSQLELIRKQIRGAHARGLKVRYWSVPEWPRGLRNYLWRVLVQEGIDYLNADDLKAATRNDWNWAKNQRGWWLYWS